MKNNQKRLFFKLDQARLKTIRDPAWACKHAQQSQYKLPATAFSLAFMNLEHPFTFSQMHNVLEWKGILKVSSSKTAWRQKNVCSANARTKRRSESLLHLSSQVSDQILSLFCFILVVLLSSMWCWLYCPLLQKSHHQCAAPFLSECFILPAVKTITLSLLFKF